ncbi:WAT1-related protein [Quillaja saponaria]|uniref:WAT1-related protein n=1 Tax=Quillaja saponaria TaxID=32244 RepID=A0AAD7M4H8_QUISA|nr:WAT1-related protein [Quillaja saponaria]
MEMPPEKVSEENMKSFFGYIAVVDKHKPFIAMLFTQFVYAGMALFSKAAIAKGMDSYVFVVYRQAFASLALAPFAFFLESEKAAPISYSILCKIFLVSLCGLTLSLNLYYVAINHTSATFAAATTNTIPAITFILAIILRMETIAIKHKHGLAKVLGSVVGLSGAMVFAFAKGPPLNFMKWYSATHKQISGTSNTDCSKVECIKGSLIMLSANTAWSLWLILQVHIVKQYPAKLRLTALQCFFSCIQSAVLAVAVQRNSSAWKLVWDVNLFSVAYCGIIVTGISHWLQVCAIEEKGPVFTAMFTPLALIITAIVSAFLWKETFYLGSVGGTILLVVGLYSVLWGKNRESLKVEAHQDKQETKEETILECIIQN